MVLGIAGTAVLLGLYILNALFTENTLVREVKSPDGKLKAVVFNRAAGPDPFSTQVSILPASAGLPRFNGNVLVTDGLMDEENVQIEWTAPRSIVLTRHEGYVTYLARDRARGVTVEHRTTKEKRTSRSTLPAAAGQ